MTGLVLDAGAIRALAVGSTVYARALRQTTVSEGITLAVPGGSVRHCVDQIDARRTVVSRQPAGPLGDRRGPA